MIFSDGQAVHFRPGSMHFNGSESDAWPKGVQGDRSVVICAWHSGPCRMTPIQSCDVPPEKQVMAILHPGDKYNWATGCKIAFAKLLSTLKLDRVTRSRLWMEFGEGHWA